MVSWLADVEDIGGVKRSEDLHPVLELLLKTACAWAGSGLLDGETMHAIIHHLPGN